MATRKSIAPSHLRMVMGGFATGVAVITTRVGNESHGMTVNSLTSVSLEPPMLLVCFVRESRTSDAVRERGAFVVNILDNRQQSLSDRFARRGEDHFVGISVNYTTGGLPMLGGLAHILCGVRDIYWGGDHDIVLGEIQDVVTRPGEPLLYFRGKYDTLTGQGRDAEPLWYW